MVEVSGSVGSPVSGVCLVVSRVLFIRSGFLASKFSRLGNISGSGSRQLGMVGVGCRGARCGCCDI